MNRELGDFTDVLPALEALYDHYITKDAVLDSMLKMNYIESDVTFDKWLAELERLRTVAATEFVKVTPNSVDKIPLCDMDFMAKCSGFNNNPKYVLSRRPPWAR